LLLFAAADCARGGDGSGDVSPPIPDDELDDAPSSPFDAASCGSATYGKRAAGSLLMVVDRSGSMAPRWLGTRAAVLGMLKGADPELAVGMSVFPALGCDVAPLATCLEDPTGAGCSSVLSNGCCGDVSPGPEVPMAGAGQVIGAVRDWFDANRHPDGFTPTLAALSSAYAYLHSIPSEGQRYVALVTDGAPTLHGDEYGVEAFDECGNQGQLLDEVSAAASAENAVKTFVIGAPGSEIASELLGEMAVRGGTARSSPCSAAAGECHYTIGNDNFDDELGRVLDTIAGLVGECTFEIPLGSQEADRDAVNVAIETADGLVPIYRDHARQDGWDYGDAMGESLQLYGPACDLYNSRAQNEVLIVLGCETVLK
jgi:hypothetical protein